MGRGRPTKYKPEYCKKIIEYFEIEPYREREVTHRKKNGDEWTTHEDVANDLPFISGFAHKIGVNTDSINAWSKKYPEFSEALKKAKELQHNILATNGLRGLYQVAFAIFTAKNITPWRDVADEKKGISIAIVIDQRPRTESNNSDSRIHINRTFASEQSQAV